MERKLYIAACALVAFAGIALAMHLLRIRDTIPASVALRGRHYSYYAYTVSRDYYVRRILMNAIFLPLLCALFGYIAHIDRQVDAVSWISLGGFYAALWWLSWEASHAYQMNLTTPGIRVGSVSDPTHMFGAAILAGLGFWGLNRIGRGNRSEESISQQDFQQKLPQLKSRRSAVQRDLKEEALCSGYQMW